MLPATGDIDGTSARQRTFGLADSTTYAQFIDYIGLSDVYRPAIIGNNDSLFKANSLLRCWAVLLADHTGNGLGVGKTDIFIKPGMANFKAVFFLQASAAEEHRWDRPGHRGYS